MSGKVNLNRWRPHLQAAKREGKSLTQNARNGIEPYQYLCALFAALPKATCLEDYEALLPWCITVAPQ